MVLLSRTLDFTLGVFTGAFAYYLYEKNPRNAVPQQERLIELTRWKLSEWKSERERRLASAADENVDWKSLVAEDDRK